MTMHITIPLAAPKTYADILVAFHKVTSDLTGRMLHEVTTKQAPKVGDGAVIGDVNDPLCIWEIKEN